MMKKLFLSALPVALLLASCSDKGGNLEQTFGLQNLNLVTNTTDDVESSIVPVTYSVHINYTDGNLDIVAPNVKLGDKTISFQTNTLTFAFTNYSYNVASSVVPTSDGAGNVTDLNCRLTSIFVRPPENVVGDINFLTESCAIMNYSWGNYKVRTFPVDAVYIGSTLTTAPGSDDFTTQTPSYRFTIDYNKLTARLIIYNGKFSDNPKMPALNLVLNDLKVVPGNNGYEITGENVVPVTLGEGTPYPQFTFSNVAFETLSTDLTSAKLVFSIASPFGELTGTFSGSYLMNTSSLQ